MGKTRNTGLTTNSKGNPNDETNSVDTKLEELSVKNTPFNSSNLSYVDSANKYENYLLDKNHKDGGSKAKFLSETLGYNKGDGVKLHNAISEAINGKTPDTVTKTIYGTKCTFSTKIKGNDGKYHHANVIVVIQQDNGKTTWRLITIMPGKKDK
ncbi:MAG: hypothetical protein IKB70_14520 [Bacilli bacterium]|nr:hypothetical protein [Bacilli bacterium]